METEYDYPVAAQVAGERSNQRIEIHLGERAMAMISRHSFIAGVCCAICVFCAGVAWWSITEHRVTQAKLDNLTGKVEARNGQ